MHPTVRSSRGGFTLLEILVALVLIGLLVGTLVPTVLNNVGRGEVNRVQEDLEAVNTATKTFRVDVQRWPGDLEDVVVLPTATDSALTGTVYPSGLLPKWNGPYLENGNAGGGISTALGGTVLNRLGQTAWSGKNYVTIKVLNVAQADAHQLSTRVDGDTAVGHTLDAAGKVRWRPGTGGADTLLYLGAPVQ